jgi:broad specificity phosphatase PhoE
MRYLEVRRHSMRVKPSQSLSPAGIALARQVGGTIGPFDLVVTSKLTRAYETAIEMGLTVSDRYAQLGILGDDVEAEIEKSRSFADFALLVQQGGPTAHLAQELAELWRSIVLTVPEGGRALVIAHGGIIEAGTVACVSQADYGGWGPICGYCEGVLLSFDGEKFAGAEMLRLQEQPEPPVSQAPELRHQGS